MPEGSLVTLWESLISCFPLLLFFHNLSQAFSLFFIFSAFTMITFHLDHSNNDLPTFTFTNSLSLQSFLKNYNTDHFIPFILNLAFTLKIRGQCSALLGLTMNAFKKWSLATLQSHLRSLHHCFHVSEFVVGWFWLLLLLLLWAPV